MKVHGEGAVVSGLKRTRLRKDYQMKHQRTLEDAKGQPGVDALFNTQKLLHEMLESKGAKMVRSFCCGEEYGDLVTSFAYEGHEYNISLQSGRHLMEDPAFKAQGWLREALEAKGARTMGDAWQPGEAEIDIALDDGPYTVTIRPSKASRR
jgi:hypothetical protein